LQSSVFVPARVTSVPVAFLSAVWPAHRGCALPGVPATHWQAATAMAVRLRLTITSLLLTSLMTITTRTVPQSSSRQLSSRQLQITVTVTVMIQMTT
jgi:hypothetical protein